MVRRLTSQYDTPLTRGFSAIFAKRFCNEMEANKLCRCTLRGQKAVPRLRASGVGNSGPLASALEASSGRVFQPNSDSEAISLTVHSQAWHPL